MAEDVGPPRGRVHVEAAQRLRDELTNALELNCHVTEDLATDGLDAILDTLEANAEAWEDDASYLVFGGTGQTIREGERGIRTFQVSDLIAALRPPVSSSQESNDA